MSSAEYTGAQLLEDIRKNRAVIGFLGTSRVGKTTRSREMAAELSGDHIEFDELIGLENGMKSLMEKHIGDRPELTALQKMALALGNPFENRNYDDEQEVFIRDESEAIQKQTKRMAGGVARNTILDFTGSAPYAKQALTEILRPDNFVSIYLQASQDHLEQVVDSFLRDPSPIYWGRLANQMYGRDLNKYLPDFMHRLLELRDLLYRKHANVILPWIEHRDQPAKIVLENIINKMPD